MPDALSKHVTPFRTPQGEPAREDQIKNNAGGFVFGISGTARLHRFLTLGTEGGTFYVSERDLTRDNAGVVTKLAAASDPALITETVKISEAGRAPRNGPALFALAAAAGLGDTAYRQAALDALPKVARTGHHILDFAEYAELFRGWGPQLTKGIGRWYTAKDPAEVAYQALKYKQRDGWAQRDLLRLSHFGRTPLSPQQRELFAYLMKDELTPALAGTIPLVASVTAAHATRDVAEWVNLIEGNKSLSWEMLPSEALREPEVWRALIEHGNLPQGALITSLAKLTRLGVLTPMDTFTSTVAGMIAAPQRLAKARIHPVSVLLAMKAYTAGKPMRGRGGPWDPMPVIIDALQAAFYAAFPAIEPSGKRIMEVTDTSGSMGWAIAGYPFTAAEVVGAMALVSARTEPAAGLFGFNGDCYPLTISPSQRLDDVMRTMRDSYGGSTDCAAPMEYARRNRMQVDVFRLFTDNETWYGDIHPHQALEEYRQSSGIDARLQVVCVAPTEFSIADPLDPRQLDVSGFDSAVPALLANHSRGDI